MTNKAGLNDHDWRLYLKDLADNHDWQVSVELLTKDDKHLVSFDEGRGGGRSVLVTGGQVNFDGHGRIMRLSVTDSKGVLLVGQDANYIDRQMHVRVGVTSKRLSKVVWTSVIYGPIWDAPRTGVNITFIVHGRERYAQTGHADTYIVKKGTRVTDAIRKILIDLAGEKAGRLANIPDLKAVLHDDLVIHRNQRAWSTVQTLAASVDRFILYDGRGYVQMPRNDKTDPDITFTGDGGPDDDGLIVGDPPTVQTNWGQIKNAVRLTGGATKNTKAPVVESICNDANFPDYPYTVEKIGYQWDQATLPHVHMEKPLQKLADHRLMRDLQEHRSTKAEIKPIPNLDFGDLVAVHTLEAHTQQQLPAGTVPLLLQDSPTLSIGYSQRVSEQEAARRAVA